MFDELAKKGAQREVRRVSSTIVTDRNHLETPQLVEAARRSHVHRLSGLAELEAAGLGS